MTSANESKAMGGRIRMEAPGALRELTASQCRELSASTPIGRIAFVVDDAPLVLPVNFAWFEDSIVFRTVEGQKLAAASDGQLVCFEVDEWNTANRTGWSVVVKGRSREVTDWAVIALLEDVGLIPWAREHWRPIWVRVDPSEVTGRLLR